MHGTLPKTDPPAEPVVKHRTITLTNRAPVRIIEDQWKTIAEGKYGEEGRSGPDDFVLIEIRVRTHIPQKRPQGVFSPVLIDHGYIVHGKYELYIEDHDADWQRVRVGRLITRYAGAGNLWKHIEETGNELRERIRNDHCRKHVIHAVDACFASLSPDDLG